MYFNSPLSLLPKNDYTERMKFLHTLQLLTKTHDFIYAKWLHMF